MTHTFVAEATLNALQVASMEGEDTGRVLSGIASRTTTMDAYRRVLAYGIFQSANVLPGFIKSGFLAKGHDWTDSKGIIMSAKEEMANLNVEAKFSPTASAQELATDVEWRLAHQKDVGLSIGWLAGEGDYTFYRDGKSFMQMLEKVGGNTQMYQHLAKEDDYIWFFAGMQALKEVSVAYVQANPDAKAESVKRTQAGISVAGIECPFVDSDAKAHEAAAEAMLEQQRKVAVALARSRAAVAAVRARAVVGA